jgi:hypothetical protein
MHMKEWYKGVDNYNILYREGSRFCLHPVGHKGRALQHGKNLAGVITQCSVLWRVGSVMLFTPGHCDLQAREGHLFMH